MVVSWMSGTMAEESLVDALVGRNCDEVERYAVEIRESEENRGGEGSDRIVRIKRAFAMNSLYKIGWVLDDGTQECMECLKGFSWFRRRHHCRSCGNLVCADCSSKRLRVPGFPEPESRVCDTCHAKMTSIPGRRVSFDLSDSPSVKSSKQFKGRAQVEKERSMSMDSALITREHTSKKDGRVECDEDGDSSEAEVDSHEFLSKCEADYRLMRTLIPVDIWDTTVENLKTRGVPIPLVKRLWDRRALWLLVMHPEDITKLHIADLRGKYSHNTLDIVEMRALWFALTRANLGRGFESPAKKEWLRIFRRAIRDFEHRLENGTLLEHETRAVPYTGMEGISIFDPDAPITKRISVSSVSERVHHFNSIKDRKSGRGVETSEARREVASLQQIALVARGTIALEIRNHIPFSDVTLQTKGPHNAEEFLGSLKKKPRKALTSRLTPSQLKPVSTPTMTATMAQMQKNSIAQVGLSSSIPSLISPDPWGWESNGSSKPTSPETEISAACAIGSAHRTLETTSRSPLSPIQSNKGYNVSKMLELLAPPQVERVQPRTHIKDRLKEHSFFFSDDESESGSPSKGRFCYSDDESESGFPSESVLPPSTIDILASPDLILPPSTIDILASPDFNFDVPTKANKRGNRRDSLQDFDSPLEDFAAMAAQTCTIADLVTLPTDGNRVFEDINLEAIGPDEIAEAYDESNDKGDACTSHDKAKPLASIALTSFSTQPFATPATRNGPGSFTPHIGFSWGKFSVTKLPPVFCKQSAGSDKENRPENVSCSQESLLTNKKDNVKAEERRNAHHELKRLLLEGRASEAKKYAREQAVAWGLVDGGCISPVKTAGDVSTLALVAREVELEEKTATEILLSCVDDPDALKEPLETLMVVVDTLGADVNARDSSKGGRTALAAVFNLPLMGRILFTRGADPLALDDEGAESAISLCLEYDCEWLLTSMETSSRFCETLKDISSLKEYCRQVILGGYGSRVHEHLSVLQTHFTEDEATELMNQCKERFQDMADPMGSYEALERLGARV